MKGLDGAGRCLKCQTSSGDDWSQCNGSCPVPQSPYYIGAEAGDMFEFHAWPPRPQGGQHLNRQSGGVLILHKPSGLGAVCVNERSQLKNREIAMRMLRQMVHDLETPVVMINALKDIDLAAFKKRLDAIQDYRPVHTAMIFEDRQRAGDDDTCGRCGKRAADCACTSEELGRFMADIFAGKDTES